MILNPTDEQLARREYYRKWRKNNPDKVAATQKRFWDKKIKQMQQEQEAENNGADK